MTEEFSFERRPGFDQGEEPLAQIIEDGAIRRHATRRRRAWPRPRSRRSGGSARPACSWACLSSPEEHECLRRAADALAGIPLPAETKRRGVPAARAIDPVLEPPAIDRRRGAFLGFLEEGGRTNLRRRIPAAARARLLLANDLGTAHARLAREGPQTAGAATDDMVVIVTSDRRAKVRRQLGLSLGAR